MYRKKFVLDRIKKKGMTMKKKDIIEGKIIKTEFPNKGTFICEDQKVTVKGVINGQRIKGQVTKKRKSGCVVRLLDVLEKSPLEDAKPVCPHFGICGGCFIRQYLMRIS